MLYDTITAISTSLQDSAISIVRLSGENAIEIANQLFSKNLSKVDSHTIHYGYILDGENKVDEVLVSVFRAPKTFTMEDVVEINCHGGRFITKKILSLCLSKGARLAKAGEFTQRAFLHGRIDLSQAEAIHDMISADSNKATQLAMSGIKGSISRLVHELINDLLMIVGHIEVNIDYPEYDDIEQLTNEVVLPQVMDLQKRIENVLMKSENGRMIKEGIKTVIVGKPNVGKSSLLNALLEEEKAIVTEVEGTTRDLVEGMIRLQNITLHLIDTAGLRETIDVVEKIGIEKTYQVLEEAELVLVVLDGSRPLENQDLELLEKTKEMNRIVITNKTDLKLSFNEGVLVSAQTGEIDNLINEINNRYQKVNTALLEPTLNNDRQIAQIIKANQSMKQAIQALRQNVELDLVTIDLQNCYIALKEIVGEVSKDDLLDAIFSNFCLGK